MEQPARSQHAGHEAVSRWNGGLPQPTSTSLHGNPVAGADSFGGSHVWCVVAEKA